MLSDHIIRNVVWFSGIFLLFNTVNGLPIQSRENKNIVFISVPASRFAQVPLAMGHPPAPFYFQQYPSIYQSPNQQTRGPFDFVGQWIQQAPWLPIEINVPDVFQNIGNGISQATNNVQQISQAVGSGVSQFAQNVGGGIGQITQNVGNGLGQFTQNVGNGINQWLLQLGQRVPFLGNIVGGGSRLPNKDSNGQIVVMVPVEYSGGQQLVLEEALEAFP